MSAAPRDDHGRQYIHSVGQLLFNLDAGYDMLRLVAGLVVATEWVVEKSAVFAAYALIVLIGPP